MMASATSSRVVRVVPAAVRQFDGEGCPYRVGVIVGHEYIQIHLALEMPATEKIVLVGRAGRICGRPILQVVRRYFTGVARSPPFHDLP